MVLHGACRTSEELLLYIGAKIGYWRGDIKGLVDDIGKLLHLPSNFPHPCTPPLPHPYPVPCPTPAPPYNRSTYCSYGLADRAPVIPQTLCSSDDAAPSCSFCFPLTKHPFLAQPPCSHAALASAQLHLCSVHRPLLQICFTSALYLHSYNANYPFFVALLLCA